MYLRRDVLLKPFGKNPNVCLGVRISTSKNTTNILGHSTAAPAIDHPWLDAVDGRVDVLL
jgi:hypothetical protein